MCYDVRPELIGSQADAAAVHVPNRAPSSKARRRRLPLSRDADEVELSYGSAAGAPTRNAGTLLNEPVGDGRLPLVSGTDTAGSAAAGRPGPPLLLLGAAAGRPAPPPPPQQPTALLPGLDEDDGGGGGGWYGGRLSSRGGRQGGQGQGQGPSPLHLVAAAAGDASSGSGGATRGAYARTRTTSLGSVLGACAARPRRDWGDWGDAAGSDGGSGDSASLQDDDSDALCSFLTPAEIGCLLGGAPAAAAAAATDPFEGPGAILARLPAAALGALEAPGLLEALSLSCPFAPAGCSAAFPGRHAWRAHLREVHAGELLLCPHRDICGGRAFRYPRQWEKHVAACRLSGQAAALHAHLLMPAPQASSSSLPPLLPTSAASADAGGGGILGGARPVAAVHLGPSGAFVRAQPTYGSGDVAGDGLSDFLHAALGLPAPQAALPRIPAP